MSFQIKSGLFQFDFTDQHSILGVPIDADFNEIRKRYMQIARRLHADTCPFENPEEKKLANQFLSKLVSPAYNKFSKENDRKEYGILLNTLGKRVLQEQNKLHLQSEKAKQLLKASNFDEAYKNAVNELAEKQYESIYQSLEVIAQLSELNTIYVLKKQQQGGSVISTPVAAKPAASPPPSSTSKPPASSTPVSSAQSALAEQACRRAQVFMGSKNYAKATLELKDGLKADPKHSKTRALLGQCYFEQGQTTMAKLEIKKALELNPQEPIALEIQKKLDPAAMKSAAAKAQKADAKSTAQNKAAQSKADQNKKNDQGGGFFSNLFGGGKKK
jgi:curved DNA-binding protein CbpA